MDPRKLNTLLRLADPAAAVHMLLVRSPVVRGFVVKLTDIVKRATEVAELEVSLSEASAPEMNADDRWVRNCIERNSGAA